MRIVAGWLGEVGEGGRRGEGGRGEGGEEEEGRGSTYYFQFQSTDY